MRIFIFIKCKNYERKQYEQNRVYTTSRKFVMSKKIEHGSNTAKSWTKYPRKIFFATSSFSEWMLVNKCAGLEDSMLPNNFQERSLNINVLILKRMEFMYSKLWPGTT